MNVSILSQNYAQINAIINTFTGEINGVTQPLVNARDLHTFLESKQEFANWISKRIENYGFIDESDFLIILSKTPTGGRPTIDYHLTLDMAKELSMVERNEKGRLARRYFIECEKQLHTNQSTIPLDTLAQNMAILATGIQTALTKLNHTERYIELLEFNQKGAIKITPEVVKAVKDYKAQGYTQASISRFLRISSASVSLIVNDKYPFSDLPSDDNVTKLLKTAQGIVEQSQQLQLLTGE